MGNIFEVEVAKTENQSFHYERKKMEMVLYDFTNGGNVGEFENNLPQNRNYLIKGMDIVNNNFSEMMSGRIGEPLSYLPHLTSSFMCAYFPIMSVPFFNDFKKIETYKSSKSKMEYLYILNLQYQDHLGGTINFRPDELYTITDEDGWNYFRTHKCSYNQQTDDLNFGGKNVKGVSYSNTLQFLPEEFYKMTPTKLGTYFLKGWGIKKGEWVFTPTLQPINQ